MLLRGQTSAVAGSCARHSAWTNPTRAWTNPTARCTGFSARSPQDGLARPSVVASAALAFETRLASAEAPIADAPSRSPGLRAVATEEATAALVNCRVVVPYYMTKIGQQLFLSGSCDTLGEWEPERAVPLEWREGHAHEVVVKLPPSSLVQAKLVLMENGVPVMTEEGTPRDFMLMPVSSAERSAEGAQTKRKEAAAAPSGEAGAGATSEEGPRPHGPRMDYQILCHFGNTEATQILRLPIVLPAKESGDPRVLCKFVVLLDNMKLEPRQFPVVVGNAPELGDWNPKQGIKLMRQVGGYWTRRAELPLFSGELQAKVVICNADGEPAQWEEGATNRILATPRDAKGAAMHVFVCRWSAPAQTPVVSVPVEHEDASKEYIKQLDAAQREIGMMRQAVTAKSRQVQAMESELAVARRTERSLREEVTTLRSDMGQVMQDLETAERGELLARKEAVEVRAELQRLSAVYEQQVTFLETKLDEMESEIRSLHDRLVDSSAVSAAAHGYTNGNGRNGNGNGNGNGSGDHVVSRSNWR